VDFPNLEQLEEMVVTPDQSEDNKPDSQPDNRPEDKPDKPAASGS
jgi:hypothetical protein